MRRRLGMLSVLFITTVLLFAGTGCDQFMQDIVGYSDYLDTVYGPIDIDDAPHISTRGKDSYLPVVEGMAWRVSATGDGHYRWGEIRYDEVKLMTDDALVTSNGHIFFDDSSYTFSSGGDGQTAMMALLDLSYTSNSYYPWLDSSMEEYCEQERVIQFDWSNYDEYDPMATITYVSGYSDVRTPNGYAFEDCLSFEMDFDYPETIPDHMQSDLKHAVVYVAQGVGLVYANLEYNDGTSNTIHVTHYTPFGETVRFFDDDGSTQLKDGKVYVEGDILTMPQVYKTGYDLTGWSDGTDVHTPGDTFVMPDVDVDFTAVWTVAEQ